MQRACQCSEAGGLKLNLDRETIDSDLFTHDLLSALIFMFMLVSLIVTLILSFTIVLFDSIVVLRERQPSSSEIFTFTFRDLSLHRNKHINNLVNEQNLRNFDVICHLFDLLRDDEFLLRLDDFELLHFDGVDDRP